MNFVLGTPSPRKKRNNSTPVKKNAAVEKKQILQQLVSPANRKLSLDEVVALATNKVQGELSTDNISAETTFTTPGMLNNYLLISYFHYIFNVSFYFYQYFTVSKRIIFLYYFFL